MSLQNKLLPFAISEYQIRLAKLQERMRVLNLDMLIVSGAENLYYLSGLSMNYGIAQYLIVPLEAPPQLLVYITEAYNADHFNWVENWFSYKPGQSPFTVIQELISQAGLDKGIIGVQKNSVSAEDFEQLTRLLPKVKLMDCSGLVEQLRMIKSPAEIEYMRQAARAVEHAMRAGLAAIEVGKTENDVAAAVYQAAILAGSEHMANTNFIVTGERSVVPHATWAGRKIQPGDIVFFEISCRIKGYTVPLLRTATLGKPTKPVVRAAESVVMALDRTISTMKPGVTSGEVQRACEQVFEETGYRPYFQHRAGYTIGLQWPEIYAMSIQPDDSRLLQPGMVFHLVPHLEFHKERLSIACGEVVLITENGHEILTNFDRKLLVL